MEFLLCGRCACDLVGVSPVDLQLKADLWSCIFQPLDGKPQTNRQLGERVEKRQKKREKCIKTCEGWRRRVKERWQREKKDRNKMHLFIKGHIMFKVSSDRQKNPCLTTSSAVVTQEKDHVCVGVCVKSKIRENPDYTHRHTLKCYS